MPGSSPSEMFSRSTAGPVELLWNAFFWNSPRGLAALLDADDAIIDVTNDYIAILKCRRDVLQFDRHTG
jgi:hypothetical protein